MKQTPLTPPADVAEGNKLIAEFMGCYGATHYIGGESVFYWGFVDTHITERWDERDFGQITPYHSSWDWLMPVVEKIGITIRQEMITEDLDILTLTIFAEKEFVYECVVQFIQWYNNQNLNHERKTR